MPLKIDDLLRIPQSDMDKVKIKFNQPSPDEDPLDLYRKNPDIINTQWLFWREQRRYFYEGQIAVCFLKIGWDKWLLTTIKKITKDLNIVGGISYDGDELPEYKPYYGRLIIQFHKTFQAQGIYYKNVCDELLVNQLLPAAFDGYDFPGYDEVRLTWEQLEIIIKQHKKDWMAALQNQKAVYLRIPLIIAPKPSTSSPRPKFREKAQFKRTICTRNKPRYATFIRLRARYKFASANSVQQC